MWPVLLLGLLVLVCAGRYAVHPEERTVRFVVALSIALASSVMHGVITDFAAVCHSVASPEVSDAEWPRVLLIGLMESTRPAALGGLFFTLIPLLVAVGLWRARRGPTLPA